MRYVKYKSKTSFINSFSAASFTAASEYQLNIHDTPPDIQLDL